MSDPFRVMVCDDSAVIRGLLTKALEADPAISVVASVQNGALAVQHVTRDDIEVVVLDIEMPVMDGLTALPKLIEAKPGIQVIMASTLTRKNADISLRALQAGAADYVPKPSSRAELHSADEFQRELTQKVKALGAAFRAGRDAAQPAAPPSATQSMAARAAPAAPPKTPAFNLSKGSVTAPGAIAIGSSTGGPQALLKVLGELPANVQQPIFITQHMPATFTTLLAEHIDKVSPLSCSEAKDGEPVVGGHIYVAPGDYHMEIVREGAGQIIQLNQNPPENFCRPAVDPMLRSLSTVFGPRLFVIILTGMGSDGCKGSEKVVAGGGTVIAQDEASSVVWGMPGAVATAGLCTAVMPLLEIAPYTRNLLMRSAA